MIPQEPFGWVWEVRFKEFKDQENTTGNTKGYYYTANTEGDQQERALKGALEHLLLQQQQQQEQQEQEELKSRNRVPAWVRVYKAIIPDDSITYNITQK
jgi:predicted phosphoadenosine phosphosulfate sulfurtransferase